MPKYAVTTTSQSIREYIVEAPSGKSAEKMLKKALEDDTISFDEDAISETESMPESYVAVELTIKDKDYWEPCLKP